MQDVVTTSKETLEGEMKAIAEAQKKLDSKRLQFDVRTPSLRPLVNSRILLGCDGPPA